MTPRELRIYRKVKDNPGTIHIDADGHEAHINVTGGVQTLYSGGTDLNDLSKADFVQFVYDYSINGN